MAGQRRPPAARRQPGINTRVGNTPGSRTPAVTLANLMQAALRLIGMGIFHEGERAVQARAGVVAEARGLGRGISRSIPPGAGPFLEGQRLAVLAGVDRAGRVWASPVMGNPGFITAPDSGILRLAAALPAADPLSEALVTGQALGVLLLDPERRRRLRINGRVMGGQPGSIEIQTEEVFGNCPKYIQARAPAGTTIHDRTGAAARGVSLTGGQRLAIEAAATFFIESVTLGGSAGASHR